MVASEREFWYSFGKGEFNLIRHDWDRERDCGFWFLTCQLDNLNGGRNGGRSTRVMGKSDSSYLPVATLFSARLSSGGLLSAGAHSRCCHSFRVHALRGTRSPNNIIALFLRCHSHAGVTLPGAMSPNNHTWFSLRRWSIFNGWKTFGCGAGVLALKWSQIEALNLVCPGYRIQVFFVKNRGLIK